MGRGTVGAALAAVLLTGAGAEAQQCPTDWPLESPLQPAAPAAAPADAQAPRVAEIRFSGQEAVEAEELREAMLTRAERRGREDEASRHDPARWPDEHRRLCAVLRDAGHLTATVGPPEVRPAAPGPDGARRVVLTIPVAEGPRYRLGALSFEGLSVIGDAEARALFDVEPGEPYRHESIAAGLQALRRQYAPRGYAEWNATVSLRPDPARGVSDVLVRVAEGLPRFVGRIEFQGHRGTLDETLRREVPLNEGALLDTDRLAASIERVEALGYVTVRGVRLTPNARNPQALDIVFEVEPRSVIRYNLAGGVSGLEGVSVTGMFGTVNLFGRGERLYVSAQLGEEVAAFEAVAARPHVFGTPWTLGVHGRTDRLDLDAVPGALPAYTRRESLVRLQAQRTVRARSAVWVGYTYTDVTLEVEEGVTPPAGFGRRRQGELSGTFRFDGWDHPWKPRRGSRHTTWGGWSAGSVDFLRARTRSFALAPLGRRVAVGAGFEAGWLGSPGGDTELPFDERFLLGGETDLRGFDVRSVGPVDAAGSLVAGTRYLFGQGELHVDVTRWLRAVAFVDAGRAWESAGLTSNWAVSTGVEARFAVPVVRLPVRLIYAWNPEREAFHPKTKWRIAIGPI
jgi:outer membrane protein insertion porin family